MDFQFEKYQGSGNDFIILDDRRENFPHKDHTLIQNLCDRHYGIGADGLILLRYSLDSDFKMLYFNSDGYPGSLCANGCRCVFAFAKKHQIVGDQGSFEAFDGIHNGIIITSNQISIDMGDVKEIKKIGKDLFMDTGSPHHIVFVDGLSDLDDKTLGKAIRYGEPYFHEGSNANFVQKLNQTEFNIRTYERGVEEETLACGTGAVAAAIAAHFSGFSFSDTICINTLGGLLQVSFNHDSGHYKNIKLTGPAVFVFSGNLKT